MGRKNVKDYAKLATESRMILIPVQVWLYLFLSFGKKLAVDMVEYMTSSRIKICCVAKPDMYLAFLVSMKPRMQSSLLCLF
jgi:hypothetical protein